MNAKRIADALRQLDTEWFTKLRPRWVDIIGSYAGKELFLVDGDALIQVVLDDRLLQLGRSNSCDFQILHAFYSVESFLHDLQKRGAVFHIIFFDSNRPLAIGTSANAWKASSRSLAHKTLKAYIQSLEFETHDFTDLSDQDWKNYIFFNKPLFILSNDHTVPESDQDGDILKTANLLHRIFLRNMLDEGLLLGSLREMDFRDSQANTFLYDQKSPYTLPDNVVSAAKYAQAVFEDLHPGEDSDDEEEDTQASDVESWPVDAIRHYVSQIEGTPPPIQLSLLFSFLAHIKMLDAISLDLRSQPTPCDLSPNLVKVVTQQFLPTVFESLESTIPENVDELPKIDGRIFTLLLTKMLQSGATPLEVLGEEVHESVTEVWSELELPEVDFGALAQFAAQVASTGEANSPPEFKEFALYPFSSPVLSECLAEVDVPTKALDDFGGVPEPLHDFDSNSIFMQSKRHQTYRSPLPKHLGGEQAKPKDRKQQWRLLRKNQRDMVHIERLANSLTGARGAKLEAEVIPPVGNAVGSNFAPSSAANSRAASRPETPEVRGAKGKKAQQQSQSDAGSVPPTPTSAKGKGGKGKKEPPLKSADKLRMQIEAQKRAKAASEGETWWRTRLEELKNIADLTERNEMIDLSLKSNKRLDAEPFLAANMWVYRVHCEVWHWIENPDREKPSVKDGYIVRLVKMVKGMKQYQNVLTPTMVKCLWSVMEAVGLQDYVEIIKKPGKEVQDKKLEFDFIKFYTKAKTGEPVDSYPWMPITEHPVDWQLRVFGEHMDRSFDSQPDPRVKFEPDKWQRDVLDKLDRDESVLVVAPTSAGKTFISYYAMKQVLTSSDDGILVYVAPTKALVTQITAEVYARYRKDLKGRSCWAIHTADIRMNNPQTCQILVTVPEMLAFMLLSPVLAKVWTPRIKRIILDEIHTLGTQPGGVWEQIILLARCPIIGLSATVGEAEEFNEWLKSIQTAHGHEHSLVQHHHRYSHLRKFIYNLDPEPEPMDGLPDHKASEQMRFLHPISFIRPGITELPSDLALEARDCATLYKAMCDHSSDPILAKLKPTKFFEKLANKGIFLQQSDVIKYETALKEVLTKWLQEEDAHKPTSTIRKVVKQLTDKEVGSKEAETALEDSEIFHGNLVNMLADLHSTGDLPAILFHFDRFSVEAIAKAILERLKRDETEWRKHSPEWERKIRGWEAWHAGAKDREKAAQRAALKKEKAEGDKMERLQNSAAVDSSPLAIYANFDPDAPSEEFSFINWASRYSAEELDNDIKHLEKATTTPRFLLECLRRGIGVHHSGLAKGYRVLIETLFRVGFCRVVVSTEDLALGVNMPAKASIFCGDSPALNALMYRQCAGRAGRRGFDLLGKVIFYGIPNERVKQVVLSKLPALRGNYPLTPTLSLRLMSLLTDSGHAPTATQAVRDMLKIDHLTIGSEINREQSMFNLRFSIEFLIRSRLIDSSGTPLHPWYNFASFLYTNEPANLALVALFKSGYIHEICQSSIIDAKRDLVHVLSFLFVRQYISRPSFDKENFHILNRTPSRVILPSLPKQAQDVLKAHNQDVLNVFTEAAVMYAIQHSDTLGSDNALPLSGNTVEAIQSTSSSAFIQSLKKSRLPIRSRSAFVATSGHGDVYSNIDELVRTVRSGVHLTKHVLPSFDILDPEDDTAGRYINAYLLDFFTHGQVVPLVDANAIPRGQTWYLLLEFSNALDAIVTGIRELITKDTRRADDDLASVAGESVAMAVQDDWAADVEDKDDSGVGKQINLPIEKERSDEAEALAANTGSEIELVKPDHVSKRDWRVFEVFFQVQQDFNDKFRAMWA
ncbi:P-loop containing nucleoside triphosphate hydrolase protein, partial [Serendipita vermifera]